MGIVGNVEEGVREFVSDIFRFHERIKAIDLARGLVDGRLLCGIEYLETVSQLLDGSSDGLELIRTNHFEVAIPITFNFLSYIVVLPFWGRTLEHQLASLLGIARFHQSANKFHHQLAIAAQHVGRAHEIGGQSACLRQRLQVAHKAVVEHERVEMVDACSLHGIIHLVHVHPFAVHPLVSHHTTKRCRLLNLVLARHVVHGVKAGAVTPDGEHVVLSGTLQAAAFQEQAHAVGVANLQFLGFLAHTVGLKTFLLNLVEVGLVVQLEPHDVAWFGILARKVMVALVVDIILTVFVNTHHAHIVVVGQEILRRLPKSVFYDFIHFSASVTIDEHGEFGGLWHVDVFLRLAPSVEFRSHVAVGLLEAQALVAIITHHQTPITCYLPLSRHHVPVSRRHGQHTFGRGSVGEVNLLDADNIAFVGVIDARATRSVGLELRVLPRLSIVPLGEGLARHVGTPVTYNLAVNAWSRVSRIVVIVTCTCGEHRHCHCATKDGCERHHKLFHTHVIFKLLVYNCFILH